MNVDAVRTFEAGGARYVITATGLNDAQKEAAAMSRLVGGDALRAAMRAALKVLRNSVLSTLPPRRSGKLRRSIRTKVRVEKVLSRVKGIVSVGGRGKNAAFYAYFLERGTGAFGPKSRSYIIRAKNKKALSIPGIGARATATVQGIRPRLFVKQAQSRGMAQAIRAFEDEFNSQLKRVSSVWKI